MADRSRQKPEDWWKDPRVPDGYRPPDRGPGSREQDRPRLRRVPNPQPKPPQDQQQQQRQPQQPQPQPQGRGIQLAASNQQADRSRQWTGQGSVDASQEATKDPREFDRMMQGAYQAGMNGDRGALDSFPDTPMGRLMRREYARGEAERRKRNNPAGPLDVQRGLGLVRS